ncbi:MAG: ribonuclease HI [Candidatus Melainabacteria bacterium]|nr:ribonuclease HI [Candidatus Melainabacteria bacterium]
MDSKLKQILIFSDGACSGNPGPGGWGSIVCLPNGTVHELGGSNPATTNNRMEMVAAFRALDLLKLTEKHEIIVYTDSVYLINGITKWVNGWKYRGWKSSTGTDIANRDLWEELSRLVKEIEPSRISWKWVRGHDGNPGNERCDQIAVSFSKKKPEQLYVGPLDGYFVDLSELPVEQPLPERKSSDTNGGAPKGAYKSSSSGGTAYYVSYLNGVLEHHTNWGDCQKRVTGKPAKFKKVKSKQEEDDTLRGWGLTPQ